MEKYILFIDKDPRMSELLSHSLGKAFRIMWYRSAEAVSQNPENKTYPDVIITSYENYTNCRPSYQQIIKYSGKEKLPIILINTRNNSSSDIPTPEIECILGNSVNSTELSLKVLEIVKKYDLETYKIEKH